MMLQFRLNPTPADPTQARIMMLMPIMFTFLFAKFPAGFVSIDDSEVMHISQQGVGPYGDAVGVFEMGGRDTEDTDHMVTEAAIRAFYRYYREVMGF